MRKSILIVLASLLLAVSCPACSNHAFDADKPLLNPFDASAAELSCD